MKFIVLGPCYDHPRPFLKIPSNVKVEENGYIRFKMWIGTGTCEWASFGKTTCKVLYLGISVIDQQFDRRDDDDNYFGSVSIQMMAEVHSAFQNVC